jgi:hypothetical protein
MFRSEVPSIQMLTSIIKLEIRDTNSVKVGGAKNNRTYVSKSGKNDLYKNIKEKMKGKGWVYKEISHSSLLFEKDGEVFGTDVRALLKGYVVWESPKERVKGKGRGLDIH